MAFSVKVGGVLAGLIRNVGGPSWRVRRLYINVIASVALYATPVWAAALEESGRRKALLRRTFRLALIRVARCYRTVSYEMTAILAGSSPPGAPGYAIRQGVRPGSGAPAGKWRL